MHEVYDADVTCEERWMIIFFLFFENSFDLMGITLLLFLCTYW